MNGIISIARGAAVVLLATAGLSAAHAQEMQVYYLMDQEAGMPVCAFPGPAGWHLASEVQWNLQNSSVPVVMGAALTNAAAKERVQFLSDLTCYWLTGDAALNHPGKMNLGMLNAAPMPPAETLVSAVQQFYRADVSDLQITGVREVPGLAAALKQGESGAKGIGLRAEYTIDGTPVEEEIYALYYLNQATLHGEAGVTTQTTWGLHSVHGFTAPRGRLDGRRNLFTHIVRSVEINPAWVQMLAQVKHRLDVQFTQDIQNNRAERERIMARSRALAAADDAFRAGIAARHRQAMDTSGHDRFIKGIHESSSHDKFIDNIHDVTTLNDPLHGTSQHSYAKEHWTDGWGSYIHSDDVTYDPNIGSTIEWQKMTPAR